MATASAKHAGEHIPWWWKRKMKSRRGPNEADCGDRKRRTSITNLCPNASGTSQSHASMSNRNANDCNRENSVDSVGNGNNVPRTEMRAISRKNTKQRNGSNLQDENDQGTLLSTKKKPTASQKTRTTMNEPHRGVRSHWNDCNRRARTSKNENPEIWFDGVDRDLLEPGPSSRSNDAGKETSKPQLLKPNSFAGMTRVIAMDCEMVGTGSGGHDSILARVSIVNYFGHCLYDKYVKPTEKVTNYRTAVSGIRPRNLRNAESFQVVQKEVSDMLLNRKLVGHAVHHDLRVLRLSHPRKEIRDTSNYKPFRQAVGGRTPSLKMLCDIMLGVKVQEGEHNSVQDAQAAMRLYTLHKIRWEAALKLKSFTKNKVRRRR